MAVVLPDLTDDLQLLLDRAIFFDPWIAALTEQDLDPRVEFSIEEGVRDILQQYWTEPERARALGLMPVFDDLVSDCLRTCALSTASLRAVWDGLPRVPDEARSQALIHDLETFCLEHGVGPIVRVGLGVLGYENVLALEHYDGMREEDFLHGRLHRPWVSRSLSSELALMLANGSAEIHLHGGIRHVRLTEQGNRRGQEIGDQLRSTGYIDRRVKALYVAHFDLNNEDYDHFFDRMVPGLPDARSHLLDLFAPAPGSRVLEVGSGTGIFTFDTGLIEAIGPSGELYTLEPSQEMTNIARIRAQEAGVRNVRFFQGRAESPPFEDNLFDGVVGSLVLHFADAEKVLGECFRVLRPGGRVAMLWALPWDIRQCPPVLEWMEPMQKLVRRPQGGFQSQRFLTLERARGLLDAAGFADIRAERMAMVSEFWHVEDVVRSTLTMGVYQEEFEQLPWAARQDLIRDLLARGERIVASYAREELRATSHAAFLVAGKPGTAEGTPRPAISLERRRRRRVS